MRSEELVIIPRFPAYVGNQTIDLKSFPFLQIKDRARLRELIAAMALIKGLVNGFSAKVIKRPQHRDRAARPTCTTPSPIPAVA